jgi:hypothetical protein
MEGGREKEEEIRLKGWWCGRGMKYGCVEGGRGS